jgi:sensor histidine kinase regulating citrate/malate metabolism
MLIGLFLLALNFLTFFICIKLLAFFESQLQTQVLQGQLDVYARQIKSIAAGHERTEAVRHEMKNLLLVLQSAIAEQNNDEAGKRLHAVLGDLDSGTLKPYTGLTVIDAMLSYKTERLSVSGATLAVHASTLEIPDEAAYDIAAMLAIMLDNAADAAATDASSFTIHCDIKQKDHIIIITFTNPLSAPLHYHNGEIASTKPESGHGLGLPSLRRLAQKYEGDIKITDTDGLFTITVLLFVSGT